jgi:hypothetical protein
MIRLRHLRRDTLVEITKLAQEARIYRDTRDPPKPNDDDLGIINPGIWQGKRPPTRAESWGPRWVEMLAMVEALSPEARAELAAVMWYGQRGGGDFAALRKEALEHKEDPGRATYICAKGPLADYLDRALREVERQMKPPADRPLSR